ncbi:MAG TPA: DNA cytosine methyltransferase, partial [Terriglobales bacterium]|nr:DNA cytosine methyltransferase [Terriglobales bacterium]
RIARGIDKFVVKAKKPFIVPLTHGGGDGRGRSVEDPFATITGANRGELGLVGASMLRADMHQSNSGCAYDPADPLRTITTATGGGHAVTTASLVRTAHGDVDKNGKRRGKGEQDIEEPLPTTCATRDVALAAATMIPRGWGERSGPVHGDQAPRVLDIEKPMPTLPAQGNKVALVQAFLAKHNGGHEATGQELTRPMDTVCSRDQKALVVAHLDKAYGSAVTGAAADAPMPTVTANGKGGGHIAAVSAFLARYNGQGIGAPLTDPMPAVTTKERHSLVVIDGALYEITDIGMRMLVPRELFRGQGFPDSYKIDGITVVKRNKKGKLLRVPLSKTAQIKCVGNSVCPPLAAALVRAQFAAVEVEAPQLEAAS